MVLIPIWCWLIHGLSSVSTRLCEPPEGRRLFDIRRAEDTLVVRWVEHFNAQVMR